MERSAAMVTTLEYHGGEEVGEDIVGNDDDVDQQSFEGCLASR